SPGPRGGSGPAGATSPAVPTPSGGADPAATTPGGTRDSRSDLFEEADPRPGPVALDPGGFGKLRDEPQEERKPLRSRRGLQRRSDGDGLPAVLHEERGPLRRTELQRRAGLFQRLANFALQHPQESRRDDLEHPVPETARRGEVPRERTDLVCRQVDEKPLGDDDRVAPAPAPPPTPHSPHTPHPHTTEHH